MDLTDLKQRLDALPDAAQREVADSSQRSKRDTPPPARRRPHPCATNRSSAAGPTATTARRGCGASVSRSGSHRMPEAHLFDTDVLIDAGRGESDAVDALEQAAENAPLAIRRTLCNFC